MRKKLGLDLAMLLAEMLLLMVFFSAREFSRIHTDVSFGSDEVDIDALWGFVYQPQGGEALKWHTGAGLTTFIEDAFGLGVTREIGLEYRFKDVPLAFRC